MSRANADALGIGSGEHVSQLFVERLNKGRGRGPVDILYFDCDHIPNDDKHCSVAVPAGLSPHLLLRFAEAYAEGMMWGLEIGDREAREDIRSALGINDAITERLREEI